jgi:hypothetical protein
VFKSVRRSNSDRPIGKVSLCAITRTRSHPSYRVFRATSATFAAKKSRCNGSWRKRSTSNQKAARKHSPMVARISFPPQPVGTPSGDAFAVL